MIRGLGWLGLCILLFACDSPPAVEASHAEPTRIISLAPHLTELAFAAGAGERLVGVVAYSDFPPEAAAIPGIGDAFNLDYERIAELEPDLVLSWEGGTPARVEERLAGMGIEILPVSIRTLEDIPVRLIELAYLAGEPEPATRRANDFRRRLETLASGISRGPPVAVFYQISLDPLYTVGGSHLISEMIALCGGRNIFADLEPLAAAVSHEAVLARSPAIVLVGRPWLEDTRELWSRLTRSAEAVRVAGIDPDLVTRPGLRMAAGAEQVCARLAAQ